MGNFLVKKNSVLFGKNKTQHFWQKLWYFRKRGKLEFSSGSFVSAFKCYVLNFCFLHYFLGVFATKVLLNLNGPKHIQFARKGGRGCQWCKCWCAPPTSGWISRAASTGFPPEVRDEYRSHNVTHTWAMSTHHIPDLIVPLPFSAFCRVCLSRGRGLGRFGSPRTNWTASPDDQLWNRYQNKWADNFHQLSETIRLCPIL